MGATALVALAATGLSVVTKKTQAKIEAGEAEVAADREELRVKQREADRKDRLASAIASQNALVGSRGISAFEGSPLAVLQDSIERERVGTERDIFSTTQDVSTIRGSARSRRRIKSIAANIGLMQAVGGVASGGFSGVNAPGGVGG